MLRADRAVVTRWHSARSPSGPPRGSARVRPLRQRCRPSPRSPARGLLPAQPRRAIPYIYSDNEVADLIKAARGLSGSTGLRPRTYATLLALLAASGMRSSEPLRLDRNDVDLDQGVLTVRESKLGKSRLMPVHESTAKALKAYATQRDQRCPQPCSPAFFLSERGTRIVQNTLEQTFVQLSRQVGLRSPSDSRGPRLHDLRHRHVFAHATAKWCHGKPPWRY